MPGRLAGVGFFSKTLAILGYSESGGFNRTGAVAGSAVALASPFGSGYTLDPVITKDLGLPYGASVSALDAYKVPAFSRAAALLGGTAAGCTFVGKTDTPAPEWLNRTDGAITPGMRLAALVLDLVCYREGVWFTERDADGQIIGAMHLPRDTWQMDPLGQIWVGGVVMPAANVLYFQSLRALGLLVAAADSIDQYHDIVRTLRSRGKNPIPLMEIHVTEDFNPDEYELKKVVSDWSAARQSENGAVAVTPPGIELKPHSGSGALDALTDARNAVRLDIANFTNLPAAMLEGNSGASGTYENTLQNKDEYLSFSMAEWLTPIEQRLSQADACGVPVRVDLSGYTTVIDAAGNTGTAVAPTIEGETA